MLPAAHRLRGDAQFRQLFRNARVVHGQLLLLRVVATENQYPRVAFVVANKIAKKAIVRNKLKRRMREIVRKLLPHIIPYRDILLTAKKDAPTATFQALEAEIPFLFQKAGIIKQQ